MPTEVMRSAAIHVDQDLHHDGREVDGHSRKAEDDVEADPQRAPEGHGGQAEEEQRHVEGQGMAVVGQRE